MGGSREKAAGADFGRWALPVMTKNFTVVSTSAGLKALASELETAGTIACDLEADSMHHFREKVCLLQMAANGRVFVIDALAVGRMEPLKPLFADENLTKVFHGADYDVRSLYRDFRIEIRNLFDTELACRFLGMRATGLDAVLGKTFGVELDKRFQRRDWSQRPLSDEMLCYAAKDTVFLGALAAMLKEELECKGRLAWVTEECGILSGVRSPDPNASSLYLKFKGAGRLSRRGLAVLEGLLALRQEAAEKMDRPLFKVIGNDELMKIVGAKPRDIEALVACNALSAKQIHRFGPEILQAVSNALELPSADLPVYPKMESHPFDPAVSRRIHELKRWRDAEAKSLKLEPSLLMTKALMGAVAELRPLRLEQLDRIPEMRNWQKRTFGQAILDCLKKVP